METSLRGPDHGERQGLNSQTNINPILAEGEEAGNEAQPRPSSSSGQEGRRSVLLLSDEHLQS